MPKLSRAMMLALAATLASGLQAEPPHAQPVLAPQGATAATRAVLAQAAKDLPPEDGVDFEFARRGFIASWPDATIRQANGQPSFDLAGNDFVEGPASIRSATSTTAMSPLSKRRRAGS
jgi:alkyl sulfatase BDS1-like metallo-beta-lactamase superfamily hydrolase